IEMSFLLISSIIGTVSIITNYSENWIFWYGGKRCLAVNNVTQPNGHPNVVIIQSEQVVQSARFALRRSSQSALHCAANNSSSGCVKSMLIPYCEPLQPIVGF